MTDTDYDREYRDKNVLITGVCGTVGSEVLKQLLDLQVSRVVGIDINENEISQLGSFYQHDQRVRTVYASLRDRESLNQHLRDIDVVIHTAALKHVGVCEDSPREAVMTNIVGTTNLIDAATQSGVKRVLFTSSDKAVNPTNVMGTSKLMGERLMTAASGDGSDSRPIMASTRFGNVLGSRGSVLPIFIEQIRSGGPLRLTDDRMTRFVMTLQEAVGLVLRSVFMAQGGEVFVTKMPVVRIEDLAMSLVKLVGPKYGLYKDDINISLTGARVGEKLYEELFNEEEMRRTLEVDDYFVIYPALQTKTNEIIKDFNSNMDRDQPIPSNSSTMPAMSRSQIEDYLITRGLID